MQIPHKVTVGGATRSLSVFNGLKMVRNGDALVAVHDAARPVISVSLIENYSMKLQKRECHSCDSCKDSIRRITADENKSVDRDQYFIVQTPQVFRAMPLINAFENNKLASFTDEASLMEQSGVEISTVPGRLQILKLLFLKT